MPLNPPHAMAELLSFYDRTAQTYAERTHSLDMSEVRGRLLSLLAPGSRILDAGCGSGRDTLAFRQEGHSVLPFDGSAGQVAVATVLTGAPVLHLTYDAVKWCGEFDAVWACSSLVHLSDDGLMDVVTKLLRTLVVNGWMYTCFKKGAGLTHDVDGRPFNNFTEERLRELLTRCGAHVEHVWETVPSGGTAAMTWVNVLVRAT